MPPTLSRDLAGIIRQHAAPCTGTRADFDPLIGAIGQPPVMLVGEASHGTHEFYQQRDEQLDPEEYFHAEQNARLVRNAEQYYRAMFAGRISSWNLRERHGKNAFLIGFTTYSGTVTADSLWGGDAERKRMRPAPSGEDFTMGTRRGARNVPLRGLGPTIYQRSNHGKESKETRRCEPVSGRADRPRQRRRTVRRSHRHNPL